MANQIDEMDAVILCGGLGTRLRSVMGETPKVMADFDGRPFLDILINNLKAEGFKRFVLCVGYQAQVIEDYYRDNPQGVEIVISREEEPLGTGGALKNAQSCIESNPFMAMNGDCFRKFNYAEFLTFHQQKKAVASIVASFVDNSQDYGRMILDESNRITEFREKGEAVEGLINAGVYCFNKDVFSLMPKEGKFSLEYDCFPKLVDEGFYGFRVDGAFFDIGTPSRYKEAKDKLRKAM